jgi:chemotaxis protein CheX
LEALIVGAENSAAAQSFSQFAREHGHGARLIPFPNVAGISDTATACAAVLFDDGSRAAMESVAKLRETTRYLNLPLIVIASPSRMGSNTCLLTACANVVCPSDISNEQIYSEMQSRCDNHPVIEELRESLLRPFCSATEVTFQEMANVEVKVRAVYQKSGYKMFGDISAVIGLLTKSEGSLVLSFPEASAAAFVRRILAGVVDEPGPDTIRDCVGEICNVIAGQARGILSSTPYAFALSTPTIVSGTGHEIRHKPGMPCLVIAYGSELGEFALQVCIGT